MSEDAIQDERAPWPAAEPAAAATPFHLQVAEERRRAEAGIVLTWDEVKAMATAEAGEPPKAEGLIADLNRRGLLHGR